MIYRDSTPSPTPDEGGGRPSVVVASAMELPLQVRRVEHPSIPETAIGLGTFIDDRLLGRQAVAAETVETYRDLLSRPRRLAYVAIEKEDGSVEGQLAAVVQPSEVMETAEEEEEESEPWRASVPVWDGDARGGGDEDDVDDDRHAALLPLGIVVRMAQRRNYPGDLAAEAADVLRSVVQRGAVEIVDQFLDTL